MWDAGGGIEPLAGGDFVNGPVGFRAGVVLGVMDSRRNPAFRRVHSDVAKGLQWAKTNALEGILPNC